MINCFSFAPRNSIPALVSKICNYLSEHPGWSREELKEALEGLVISESTGKICYFSEGDTPIEELNLLDLYNSSYRLVFTAPTDSGEYTKLYGLEYQSGNVVAYQLMSGISENDFNAITALLGEKYSADNPPPYPVTSVNGKTGAVTGLYSNENQPPYPVVSVNGKTGAVVLDEAPTDAYTPSNPPPYPVISVNGKTGAVTGLYDSDNPPPYPVRSVNGKTGAVTGLYDSDNPPPYPVRSVNGKTGAVTIETPIIKTATLTFSFNGEDMAHICMSNIVSNANKIISINPVLVNIFAGGIEYSNGYIVTNFINRDAELVTENVTCNVVYYE